MKKLPKISSNNLGAQVKNINFIEHIPRLLKNDEAIFFSDEILSKKVKKSFFGTLLEHNIVQVF